MGDIVDRGSGATESWECLQYLQDTAPAGSSVIRLVGNHELWWLEGTLHMRNKNADTKEKVAKLVGSLKDSISSGIVRAGYHRTVHGEELLFIHAGYRKKMKSRVLKDKISTASEAAYLVNFADNALQSEVRKCLGQGTFCPEFKNELFGAGPERGGKAIGGPFWTDYSVIHSEETEQASDSMIQV